MIWNGISKAKNVSVGDQLFIFSNTTFKPVNNIDKNETEVPASLIAKSMFGAVQSAKSAHNRKRGVYRYTLSVAVCSAIQQMSVFQ